MWLTDSSIGRKVVMSVSGAALVLFLTFHMAMNLVYIFSDEGYNKVCEFLGTNWYALAGTAALAFLVVVHFIYAFILTIQNRKARGNVRYEITGKQPVGFAAKNMLVLGIIIICGLFFHLYHFWYNMMFAELAESARQFEATDGAAWITFQFSHSGVCVIYAIWFAALWYHITHGIWSSMQTLGLSGKVWLNRWICTSKIWATIVALGFLAVMVAGIVKAGGFTGGLF